MEKMKSHMPLMTWCLWLAPWLVSATKRGIFNIFHVAGMVILETGVHVQFQYFKWQWQWQWHYDKENTDQHCQVS